MRVYPWPQRAERFTDKPFDAVALDAFAHFFAGGDAQARAGSRPVLQARENVYHKIAIQVFSTFLIGTLEFPPFFEPVWVQYFCCSQCVRGTFLLQCYLLTRAVIAVGDVSVFDARRDRCCSQCVQCPFLLQGCRKSP